MFYVSSSLAIYAFEKFDKAKSLSLYRSVLAYEPEKTISFAPYARAPTTVHVGKAGVYITSFRPSSSHALNNTIPVWVYYPQHVEELRNMLKDKPLTGTLAHWVHDNAHRLAQAVYEKTRQPQKVTFKVASFQQLTQEQLARLQVSFRLQNIRGDVYTVWSSENEPHELLPTAKEIEIDNYFDPFDWTANSFLRPFALFSSTALVEKALQELFLVRHSQQRVADTKQSILLSI